MSTGENAGARGTAVGGVVFVCLAALAAWSPVLPAQDPVEAAWTLARPAPAVALRPAVLERAAELACAACHAPEVEEWSRSAHALAWVDEVYQEELEGRTRPETCHGCHIPEPLFAQGLEERPSPRAADQHFGVSCETCHLGPAGEMLGTRGEATDAHASARSESLVGAGANALCAACHRTNIGPVVGIAKDFEVSKQAERGRTCVGCHMASVEREDGTESRSHALQTPRDPTFLARAFALRLEVAGGKCAVVVENRAGHRVPGLIGREIVFAAEALDAGGKVVAKGRLELDTRSFLPVDGSTRLELPAAGVGVRVTGEHHDPRSDEAVRFIEELLEP